MGREASLWNLVLSQRYPGHWVRIENLTQAGTPDVNWASGGKEGWIELKCIALWPARQDSILAIPHYTEAQRRWIKKRARAGGRVHLFLKVQSDYLLFNPKPAVEIVGLVPKQELIEMAIMHIHGAFPKEFFYNTLLFAPQGLAF